MTLTELHNIVDGITDLPTLPTIIMKVIEIINNPKSSATDIKKLIESDVVQAVRVLRLANSSYYGFPQKVSTITTAIVLLGFNEIKNLLLSSSVYEVFMKSKNLKNNYYFDNFKFLDHSIAVAIACRIIAKEIKYDEPEELFVGGLLHDIGKNIMQQFLKKDFKELMKNVLATNSLMYKKEKRIIGYTHSEVGKILAKKWKMTDKIVDIIAYHHHPKLSQRFTKEAAIVQLADIFVRAMDIGSGGDNQVPSITEEIFESIGLSYDKIEKVMFEIEKTFEETKEMFNVVKK